jgi:hypothetical protein
VSRAFTDDLPCRAIHGEKAWAAHLDTLDLRCDRPDFALRETSTALALSSQSGAFGQLFRRMLRRGLKRAA